MSRLRDFAQVDVFSTTPYLGNPVAVVLNAEGVTDDQMQRLARWTDADHARRGLSTTDLRPGRRAAVCRAPDPRLGARLGAAPRAPTLG
jgi:hypothetical protein